jgi:hypothetical protein
MLGSLSQLTTPSLRVRAQTPTSRWPLHGLAAGYLLFANFCSAYSHRLTNPLPEDLLHTYSTYI